MAWCLGIPLFLVAAYLLNGWEERRREALYARANWEWQRRDDIFVWDWRVNYEAMRGVFTFNVYDYPPVHSEDVYLVRREGGRWERLLTPESRDREIAELMMKLENLSQTMERESDLRARLKELRAGPRWEPFEQDLQADLEEHYQQRRKPLGEWRRWAKARNEIHKAARNSDRRAA